MSIKITRPDYAAQYGPTTGDKIHLADTGDIVGPLRSLGCRHRVALAKIGMDRQ